MRIVYTIVASVLLVCIVISPAQSRQEPGALVFSTIIQAQGWHVTDLAVNNRKSILFGGSGGYHADGLVLVTDSQSRKFLSFDGLVLGA